MDRTLLLALILFTAAAIAETDNNLTSRQPSWSTAVEESDLLPPDASVPDSDGGFSSMDSMLHWAISMHNLNIQCHKNYFVILFIFVCFFRSFWSRKVKGISTGSRRIITKRTSKASNWNQSNSIFLCDYGVWFYVCYLLITYAAVVHCLWRFNRN